MTDYLGIIMQSELEKLRNARKPGRIHPLAALAFSDPHTFEAANTENAARHIAASDPAWLSSQRGRLLDTTDFTAASSALGEIRAYGALLEAGYIVHPRPRVGDKVPEFDVDVGDGPVIVEVHTRQLDLAVQREIAHAELVAHSERGTPGDHGVTVGEPVDVVPFGPPNPKKKGDSVATNAISRVARIKEDENQVDHTKPFVLWLDLQDMTVWGLPLSDQQFSPLYTENNDGEVGSGSFWFALYGRKGDPMIEMLGCDYCSVPMLHDGRFYQRMKSHGGPTRVSAYVFALPSATVLMEHPTPLRSLPPKFRATMLRTPHFRLDLARCEWDQGLVEATVGHERRTVAAIARALEAQNPR